MKRNAKVKSGLTLLDSSLCGPGSNFNISSIGRLKVTPAQRTSEKEKQLVKVNTSGLGRN